MVKTVYTNSYDNNYKQPLFQTGIKLRGYRWEGKTMLHPFINHAVLCLFKFIFIWSLLIQQDVIGKFWDRQKQVC